MSADECPYSRTCDDFDRLCNHQYKECREYQRRQESFIASLKVAKKELCPLMLEAGYKNGSAMCDVPRFRAALPDDQLCHVDGQCRIRQCKKARPYIHREYPGISNRKIPIHVLANFFL